MRAARFTAATEQLACGLGLGMMAVAALTLGVKLCGCHGRGWVLTLTALGALTELWRDRKTFGNGIAGNLRKIVSEPVTGLIYGTGLVVFLILFRLAALQGIVEFDAVADWVFKAKIFFLCTGHDIVGWFSNPRLAYAHLDYPTLVPSLHAATYDSIGHVDEFVTKFWPVWMLLFLLGALASMVGTARCAVLRRVQRRNESGEPCVSLLSFRPLDASGDIAGAMSLPLNARIFFQSLIGVRIRPCPRV